MAGQGFVLDLVSEDLAPALRAWLDDPAPHVLSRLLAGWAGDLPGGHPEPIGERDQRRPVLLPRLWDLLRVRRRRGDLHLPPALGAGRGRSGALLRDRHVGVPSRADRRADLLRHHHSQPDPRSLVGHLRHLAGRPRHLGRHRRRRRGGALGRAPAFGPQRSAATDGRRRPRAPGRPGDRADRQLLQSGAVRRPVIAAVGPEDLPRAPAARLPPRPHVRAHLPLRDHLEPVPGHLPGLARLAAQDPGPGAVRALRRGLLGLPDLRGDPAHRLLQPLPGAARQLLRRRGPLPRRPAVVRGGADGLARLGSGPGRGRARERPCRGSDAGPRVPAHRRRRDRRGGCRWRDEVITAIRAATAAARLGVPDDVDVRPCGARTLSSRHEPAAAARPPHPRGAYLQLRRAPATPCARWPRRSGPPRTHPPGGRRS